MATCKLRLFFPLQFDIYYGAFGDYSTFFGFEFNAFEVVGMKFFQQKKKHWKLQETEEKAGEQCVYVRLLPPKFKRNIQKPRAIFVYAYKIFH